MKIIKNGQWVDGQAHGKIGSIFKEGTDAYVKIAGVWVRDLAFVPNLPIFTLHPVDFDALDTGNASFTVAVDDYTSLQWQKSADSGNTIIDATGKTELTYNLSGVAIEDNGLIVRCKATNGDGSSYSNWATLNVSLETGLPTVGTISTEPATPVYGQVLTLICAISNARTWEWQADINDGRGFISAGQVNAISYEIHTLDNEIGWKYRVVAENINGPTVGPIYTVPDVAPPQGNGITASGKRWLWEGNNKIFVGCIQIGEPFLYEHIYDANSIKISDGSNFLKQEMIRLSAAGVNLFRCTMQPWQPKYTNGPMRLIYPFPGHPNNFNLNAVNQDYFDRLDAMLYVCRNYGIVANIEIWDPWFSLQGSVWLGDGTDPDLHYAAHYFNPKNVTSPADFTEANTGLPENGLDSNGNRLKDNTLMYTPVINGDYTNPLVIAQQKFVDALCAVLIKHDNYTVQIENEPHIPDENDLITWLDYWADYVAAALVPGPKTTQMGDRNLNSDFVRHALSSSKYQFGDTSQGNVDYSLDDTFDAIKSFNSSNGGDKPVNAIKVYSRGPSTGWGDHNRAKDIFFVSLLAENAGVAFHPGNGSASLTKDGGAGLGASDKALRCVNIARIIDNTCGFHTLNTVSRGSSKWSGRPSNKAFAADSSNYIVIYVVGDHSGLTFDTTGLGASFQNRWFDIDDETNKTDWSPTYSTKGATVIGNPISAYRRILFMKRV